MERIILFIQKHGRATVGPYHDAIVNRGSIHARKVEGASYRVAIFPTRRKAQAFVDICSQCCGLVTYGIKPTRTKEFSVRFR